MENALAIEERDLLLEESYQKMNTEGKDLLDRLVEQLAEAHQSMQKYISEGEE